MGIICTLHCRTERSTDQVIKPVNLDALDAWVMAIPSDVRQDMAKLAPMLSVLGYDPNAYPPKYGEADSWVKQNTLNIKQNADYWKLRNEEILSKTRLPSSVQPTNYINSTKN